MSEDGEYSKIIKELRDLSWDYRYSITGLLLFFCLWVIVVIYPIYPTLSKNYGFLAGWEYFIIEIVVGWAGIFIWWFIKRRPPYFSDGEIGIIFAVTNKNKKTNKVTTDLYNSLNLKIKNDCGISNFVIRRIPSEISPTNFEKAYRLRDRSNAILLIWGNLEEGNYKGDKAAIFLPLNFTFSKPPDVVINNKYNTFKDEALANKKWVIKSSEDVVDTEYVAQNMSNFCFYLIAYCLMVKGYFEEAISIIKEIRPLVIESGDKITKERLDVLYRISQAKNIHKLNLSSRDKGDANKIDKARRFIVDIISFSKLSPDAPMLNGVVEFLDGNIDKAMNSIVLAKQLSPSGDAAPFYSMAFLQFYNNQLEYGWNQLKETFNKTIGADALLKILQFYEETLERESEKYMLHFSLGVLYYDELEEKELAKENIKKFMESYKFGDTKWEKEIKEKCDKIINEK